MRKLVGIAAAAASVTMILGISSAAQASTLTFDGNICTTAGACTDSGHIAQNYGDTANVDVQYNRDVTNLALITGAAGSELEFWDTQYSDLLNVAYGGTSDSAGTPEIFLKALNGSTVTLNGFDLGAFNGSRSSKFTIVDGLGKTLASSGQITVGLGEFNVHNHYAFNLSSNTGIGIKWGPNGYNVGIDNVEFNSGRLAGAVPEPATWGLVIMGFGGIGAVLRRRRNVALLA